MYKRTLLVLNKIRKLSAKGYSQTEIGQVLGKTRKSVQKMAKRYGIKPFFPQGGPFGERNGFWKRGWKIDKDGYKLIYKPDHPFARHKRYVLEHRLMMESHLKRYLTPLEVVHHKNKNKLDNRIENLELFSKNSEHLKVELTGKCPKWSEDGIQRIKEGISKPRKLSVEQIRHIQERGRYWISRRKRDAKGRLLPKIYASS